MRPLPRCAPGRHSLTYPVAALLLALAAPGASGAEASAYQAQFLLGIRPGEPAAAATIRVTQRERMLRQLRLAMPESRFSAVTGDGSVTRDGDSVTWAVPREGGDLRFRVEIPSRRGRKGYNALLTESWTIFRADDVFPPAGAVHRRGAKGRSEILLDVPAGWSVLTPYLPDAQGRLRFEHPQRSFARPVGWVLAGQIGARMDVIGDTTVRVAAPRGQGAQRVPMLALVRSTLPVLQEELAGLPPYLLIVTAGDPMWRGGLSAPNSLFVHADRPLISENGTSTLVHELVHVLAPVPAATEQDWIDEGLAEYLGLVMLLRGHAISRERFDHAIETFRRRGMVVRSMLTRSARGPVTARAVAVFHDLDAELQKRTDGRGDIFELLRRLMREPAPADLARLRALAAEITGGGPPAALSAERVPGAD